MESLTNWWSGLEWGFRLFYVVGYFALAVIVVQALLLLLGVGGVDIDDVDFSGDGAHDTGMGLISLRTVTAFFLGFGWGGVTAMSNGFSFPIAIIAGLVLGAIFMAIMFYLMRLLHGLKSSGTVKLEEAIGKVATVYVTIPAKGQGSGQIEIMIQGRLMTISACSERDAAIAPQQKVRVVKMLDANTFVVEPAI